jgi:hypothetical protein
VRGYVLSWDFAMLYTLEREWFPIYKLDWRTHRHLPFISTITSRRRVAPPEDRRGRRPVAFVSGYDLTRVRWDTSRHAEDDPCRVDHRG